MFSEAAKTFLIVAAEGSFSKAADKLYISPTAVKKRIDAFEKETGIAVFYRSPRGITITQAGRFLHEKLSVYQQDIEQLLQQAVRISQDSPYSIRIGRSWLFPCDVILKKWETMMGQHPEYQIQLVQLDDQVDGEKVMISSLRQDVDLVFSSQDFLAIKKEFVFYPMGYCQTVLCLPITHPLSSHTALQLDSLHGETICCPFPDDHPIFKKYYDHILEYHPQIKLLPLFQNMTLSVINQCATIGQPFFSLDYYQEAYPLLKAIPMTDAESTPYGAICASPMRKEVRDFLQLLTKDYILG